ncbi:MAG: chromosomal replication initiator protein DnaA [Mariprofundaceae bacterium]
MVEITLPICEWEPIFDQLANQIPASQFDAWIRPIQAECEQQSIALMVPSRFFLDGLKERYESMIQAFVQDKYGASIELRFVVNAALPKKSATTSTVRGQEKSTVDGYLDPRFTFENFVVGSSNEFCHAACRAVAEKPGTAYNPLYLYGGVGLGKTHLGTAVANALLAKRKAKIAYRSGESFTNELITAIRNGSTQQFRNRYRRVDVLIIDDVQFIAGKLSTQEEFFHTFNALYELRKQIILTSDRCPRDINHLEERLKSRFNWGLVADIQPPDLETRQAILACKAELADIRLPDGVAFLLSSRITSNVRELEGALTRLTAHATLTGKTIDMPFTRHVLRDLLQEKVKLITVEDIQKTVANYYNIRVQDMRSAKRSRSVSFPRQVAMYAAKQLTTMSLPAIGEAFGGKDHTTVMHAVRKIKRMKDESHNFQDEVDRILSLLRA